MKTTFLEADKVAELTTQKAHADQRLEAQFKKIKAGSTDPLEVVGLSALADECNRLADELAVAQREAEEAEQRRRQQEADALRARLDTALVNGSKHREEFTAAYRAACVALGRYCEAVATADKLSLTWAALLDLGPLHPTRGLYSQRITGLRLDDPLPALFFNGLTQDVIIGAQFSFPVVPLHEKTEKEKSS